MEGERGALLRGGRAGRRNETSVEAKRVQPPPRYLRRPEEAVWTVPHTVWLTPRAQGPRGPRRLQQKGVSVRPGKQRCHTTRATPAPTPPDSRLIDVTELRQAASRRVGFLRRWPHSTARGILQGRCHRQPWDDGHQAAALHRGPWTGTQASPQAAPAPQDHKLGHPDPLTRTEPAQH